MLKQKALVTEVMLGQVEVEVAIESTCSGCSSNDTCGVGTVAKAFTGKTQRIIVATNRILSTGQWVEVATEESNLLILAALTYLLPLFGLVLTGLIAQQVFTVEIIAVLSSFTGAVLFHLLAKRIIKTRESQLPTISIV